MSNSGSSTPPTQYYRAIAAAGNSFQLNGNIVNHITHNHAHSGSATGITRTVLLAAGVGAVSYMLGRSGSSTIDDEFPSFRKDRDPESFFRRGKVFETFWIQPEGVQPSYIPAFVEGTSRRVKSEVRRFVVIEECKGHSICLSIATYGPSGVSGWGLRKSDYGIVYTGSIPPQLRPDEWPQRGELGLQPVAIRVTADDRDNKLDETSRIDYHNAYTIEHNLKVRSFGWVKEDSMPTLLFQSSRIWKVEWKHDPSHEHTRNEKWNSKNDAPSSIESSSANKSPLDPDTIAKTQIDAAIVELTRLGYSRQQAIIFLQRTIAGFEQRGISRAQAIQGTIRLAQQSVCPNQENLRLPSSINMPRPTSQHPNAR